MHSGNSSVAFFSSWVTSTHWITSVTEKKNLKNTIIAVEAKQQPNRNEGLAACKLSVQQYFSPLLHMDSSFLHTFTAFSKNTWK